LCVKLDNYQVSRKYIISGFNRASLLEVTFINQLMHSIITVIDVKILLYKSKRHTLKITPTRFGSHRIHH